MPDVTITYDLILLLFVVGILAGGIDAVAGGGGLVALPVLLSIGLSPVQALATNKMQGSFGTFAATVHFIRCGLVDLRGMRWQIICTFVGAMLGTVMVKYIGSEILSQVVPFLLILIALHFLFSTSIQEQSNPARISENLFGLTVGFSLGFYDGFFGPGTGTFFAMGFVSLLGCGLTAATARTKVLNFTSNIASLTLFALSGDVIWSLGIIAGIGQLFGARLGAHFVVKGGAKFIKPIIVTISILISLKLLFQEYF